MSRALRWPIPVDDQPHALPIPAGPVVHVACRTLRVVDVWVVAHDNTPPGGWPPRRFYVTGTGQAAPPGAWHVGTALTPATLHHAYGALVWHLWELPAHTHGAPRELTP